MIDTVSNMPCDPLGSCAVECPANSRPCPVQTAGGCPTPSSCILNEHPCPEPAPVAPAPAKCPTVNHDPCDHETQVQCPAYSGTDGCPLEPTCMPKDTGIIRYCKKYFSIVINIYFLKTSSFLSLTAMTDTVTNTPCAFTFLQSRSQWTFNAPHM